MTFGKFFYYPLLYWAMALFAKYLYFSVFDPSIKAVTYAFYGLILIFTIICIRRVGVINYLESIMAAIFWLVIVLLLDLVLGSFLLKVPLLAEGQIWTAYLVMVLGIFIFHKKRHVKIRKELGSHPLKEHIFGTVKWDKADDSHSGDHH